MTVTLDSGARGHRIAVMFDPSPARSHESTVQIVLSFEALRTPIVGSLIRRLNLEDVVTGDVAPFEFTDEKPLVKVVLSYQQPERVRRNRWQGVADQP